MLFSLFSIFPLISGKCDYNKDLKMILKRCKLKDAELMEQAIAQMLPQQTFFDRHPENLYFPVNLLKGLRYFLFLPLLSFS